jgi:hypothetical protein
VEPQKGRVEGVTLELGRAVRQPEEAVCGDRGRAVEREVRACETVEGELVSRRGC